MSSTKRFTTKGFIKFCESQPQTKQIDYGKSDRCPLGLYAETLGYVNIPLASPWRQLTEHSTIANKVDFALAKLSYNATYANAVKVLKRTF